MKKLFVLIMCILSVFVVDSCTTSKNLAQPATVDIINVTPGDVSVQFELSYTNAVSVGYRVETLNNSGKAEFTVVDVTQLDKIVCTDLTQETDYQISAVAYNEDGVVSEEKKHTFRTSASEPFGEIKLVPTAHGIYIESNVDTEKYPLYFLQIFDPERDYTDADFKESFKVDSKEQFIHYLETAFLNVDIRRKSFKEWNKTMLSSKAGKVYLYAVPVVQKGTEFICESYGRIIEKIVDIPASDVIGESSVAIMPGEPVVENDVFKVTLSKQGEPVAYYAGIARKSDVDAAGTLKDYVQSSLDARTFDYHITSIDNFQESYEQNNLAKQTDYVFFTFAYDSNGKLGALQSKDFSIAADDIYMANLTVDVALKDVAFTSAVFSVKRHNFKNGKYNVVKISDFESKYNNDVDLYVQQELIAHQSGWPSSLYSDNDIKMSRLTYNTEYMLIVLPESDQKDGYGKPATVRFRTKEYKATSNVSLTIKVNDVKDPTGYGASFLANVTVTPDASCVGYYSCMLDKAIFEAASNLGETVCKKNGLKYVSADSPQQYDTDYCFSPSYLVLIPVDKDGNFGKPVSSELLELLK